MTEGTSFKRVFPLSLYGLAMVWSPVFGTSEAAVFASLLPYQNELLVSRVVSLGSFGLSMLLLSFLGKRLEGKVDSLTWGFAFAALGSLGMLVGSLVGVGVLPLSCLYVGAFFRGIYYTVASVAWVGLFTRFSWKAVSVTVSASLVLYAVVGLLIMWLASAVAAPIAVAVLVLCPLLSYWGYRASCGDEIASRQAGDALVPLRTRFMLYLANLMYGAMLGMIIHYFAMFDTVLAVVAFFAMSLLMMFVFCLGRDQLNLYFVYRAFMMAVAILIPAMMLAGWLGFTLASLVASAILSVLIFYTVVIFSDTQARLSNPFWKVPGMCQFFAAIGMAASSVAFRCVLPEGTSSQELMLVSAACILFVASVFSPNDRSQVRPWGFSSLLPSESPEIKRLRRCGELADSFRLTSRELEILQQLASGNSRDEIAATLIISPATAKTHIRNIYAKLGVHSQKELTELVEG